MPNNNQQRPARGFGGIGKFLDFQPGHIPLTATFLLRSDAGYYSGKLLFNLSRINNCFAVSFIGDILSALLKLHRHIKTAGSSKIIGTREPDIDYTESQAVRVVTFNDAREIAIIHAKRDNYCKLPGGGIDPGEDHLIAVQREMQEETGVLIKVHEGDCVATTEEFRNDAHQISVCYTADLDNNDDAPSLKEDEIQHNLQHQWLPIDQAKTLMVAAKPTSVLGNFIKERDIYLLEGVIKKRELQ